MMKRQSITVGLTLLCKPQFVKFAIVGGTGFCIDGGLLTLLMESGWEILPARALSFLTAATCTWNLNRFLTFKLEKNIGFLKEYVSYIATQVLGAAVNLLVFFASIGFDSTWRNTPLIPLAIGSAVALIFNYTVSKKYVFNR